MKTHIESVLIGDKTVEDEMVGQHWVCEASAEDLGLATM